MKKSIFILALMAICLAVLAGCGNEEIQTVIEKDPSDTVYAGTAIVLSDDTITVDGQAVSTDPAHTVYIANDIIYYEEGHDFTYGEGEENDAHSQAEAAAHTVVHITQPGTYILSGKMSRGQVAVDLGENATEDPNAVVTLVLDGVDITCSVAPGIIFYNVYECGSADTENATHLVDTSAAGANVVIADGSSNLVTGSYVARIYKPDSVVLSEDGTEVEDAKKLHKYDGAFYSKMSMNILGGEVGNGVLDIVAENEGLDSELHLTVNGGNVRIRSGNDGINTNEDGVSVTTVNGGSVDILVTGETGEGDGIDSNGWLVINGGNVTAQACAFSADAGIDSDMGIHITGGNVIATGSMLDKIEDGSQNHAVFQFSRQEGGLYTLKNHQDAIVAQAQITNGFSTMVISSEDLTAGDYTLWRNDTQLEGMSTGNMGMFGGMGGFAGGKPEDMEFPEKMKTPEDMPTMPHEPPQEMTPPQEMEKPERPNAPAENDFPHPPSGGRGEPGSLPDTSAEASEIFTITDGGNYFQII